MMDDEEDPQSANRLCLHNFSATNLVRNTFFKIYLYLKIFFPLISCLIMLRRNYHVHKMKYQNSFYIFFADFCLDMKFKVVTTI